MFTMVGDRAGRQRPPIERYQTGNITIENPARQPRVTIDRYGNVIASGWLALGPPATKTGTAYTVGATDSTLIISASGAFTITLPAPSANTGRLLTLNSIAAFAISSASSNVTPINSATPGTAILSANAGTWCLLQSDGTNWITIHEGDVFTSTVPGFVPASGGGTGNFLRADGTWAATSGAPGGSTLQVQYNNAGVFGGMAGTSWDNTNQALTITKLILPNYNTSDAQVHAGNMDLQSYSLNNAWLGENLYFNGTAWTRRVTGTASNFYFFTDGFNPTIAGWLLKLYASGSGTTGLGGNNPCILKATSDGLFLVGPALVGNKNIDQTGAQFIVDPAINTASFLNSTTAYAVKVYNTFTDTSNYERGAFDWTTTANTLTIGTQKLGTGSSRNVSLLSTNDINIQATNNLNLQTTNWTTFSSTTAPNAAHGIALKYTSTGSTYYLGQDGNAGNLWMTSNSLPGSNIGDENQPSWMFVIGYNDDSFRLFRAAANGVGGAITWVQQLRLNVLANGASLLNVGWLSYNGTARVVNPFSVTSSTALVNVTGLSVNLAANRNYIFEVYLTCSDAAAGGLKAAMSGTVTVGAGIVYDGWINDGNTVKGQGHATALGTAVANATTTATTGLVIQIAGLISTGATAGTLTVQFAQNTSNGTSSTVGGGSWMQVVDCP
jgi:hypothetical protein